MIFSSAEYPVFLLAVFFIYLGLHLRHPPRALAKVLASLRLERFPFTLARILALLFLGDLVYLLLSRDLSSLWDPFGALVFRTIAKEPPPLRSLREYFIGANVFAWSLVLGEVRGRWLASDRGQQIVALLSAVGLSLVGIAIFVFWRVAAIEDLNAFFSGLGHLIYLAIFGFGLGSSLREDGLPLGRLLILFLVSAIFYHAWSAGMPRAYKYLLLLILGTITLDYYLALWIDKAQDPWLRRALLVLSLVSNLGILALFKYFDFFLITLKSLALTSGLEVPIEPFALILPAGISFHTFQSLSYTIDVYKRQIKPTRSILEFATFVLFFPQLVAGPIVRAHEFMPQLRSEPVLDPGRAAEGMYRILIGLLKKLVLADVLASSLVDRVFERPELFSGIEAIFAVYGYALQIYLDFSAYSDIAIGSALLLGFEFPENFRTPYRSADLQEFWRRWHITLSSWLRDYLYVPLGGSRGTPEQIYRNLLITMLLGGLWHGANWTFIVWGALHGGGLAMTRVWQRRFEKAPGATLQRLALVLCAALTGVFAHFWLLAQPIDALGEWISLDPAWIHLGLAWLYLTPAWALLSASLPCKTILELRKEQRGSAAGFVPFSLSVELSALIPACCLLISGVLFLVGYLGGAPGLEIAALVWAIGAGIWMAIELSREAGRPTLAPALRAAFLGVSLILLRATGVVPLGMWLLLLLLWLLLAILADVAEASPDKDALWRWGRALIWRAAAVLLTFHYVCFAWIFFRATSFEKARQLLAQIGTGSTDAENLSRPFLYALALGVGAHLFPEGMFRWLKDRFLWLPPQGKALLIFSVAVLLKHLASPDIVPFIYFQF